MLDVLCIPKSGRLTGHIVGEYDRPSGWAPASYRRVSHAKGRALGSPHGRLAAILFAHEQHLLLCRGHGGHPMLCFARYVHLSVGGFCGRGVNPPTHTHTLPFRLSLLAHRHPGATPGGGTCRPRPPRLRVPRPHCAGNQCSLCPCTDDVTSPCVGYRRHPRTEHTQNLLLALWGRSGVSSVLCIPPALGPVSHFVVTRPKGVGMPPTPLNMFVGTCLPSVSTFTAWCYASYACGPGCLCTVLPFLMPEISMVWCVGGAGSSCRQYSCQISFEPWRSVAVPGQLLPKDDLCCLCRAWCHECDTGKRFRPVVVLLMGYVSMEDPQAAAALHKQPKSNLDFIDGPECFKRQIRLAEISELIHTASLIHDDILGACSPRCTLNPACVYSYPSTICGADNSSTRRGSKSLHTVVGNKVTSGLHALLCCDMPNLLRPLLLGLLPPAVDSHPYR